MGAEVTVQNIDTAHRLPSRSDRGSAPKPIICKFVRRLAKERVMECWKDAGSINPPALGLPDQVSLSEIRIFDHLTPKMQSIPYEAEKFKNQHHYQYWWAKNSVVYLKKDATARPIKIKGMDDLQWLADFS